MTAASLLSQAQLARIAVSASSLWERIDQGFFAHDAAPARQSKIDTRLNTWRDVVAEGDHALFARRLAYDGLDADRMRMLLGGIKLPVTFEIPRWGDVLNGVLRAMPAVREAAVSPSPENGFRYLRKDAPLPFEELLLPFIAVAREMLSAAGRDPLPGKVLHAFERALLAKLAEIAARVLAVEFRAFLASRQLSGLPYVGVESGSRSRVQYLGFIAETYAEGWAPLFEEYCVMARLLATAVLQWVETVGEFAGRLSRDLPEIEKVFNGGKASGGIAGIRTGLSDPHDGGRTVIAVAFVCGLKLIYKPRCLALERAYFGFAAWLDRLATLPRFRLLTILDRGAYGWVEHVEHRSCATEDEIRRYHVRSGVFLCLVYALNGIDFHYENLIADGEHPVPVDLETIFHHQVEATPAGNEPLDEMAERLRVSVLATDLLPDPVKMNHQYFDISALARSEEEEGEVEVLVWKHINTDGMDYDYAKKKPAAGRNLPRLDGKAVSPDEYTESLLDGFRKAYRLLLDNKDELSADGGPLRPLFAHEARFIFRSTAFYMFVLNRAFHPDCLRDGVDLSVQMDILARSLIKTLDKPGTWPLIRAETEALWQTDVPKFSARGDGVSLTLRSGDVGCFVESAWNRVRRKIGDLSEDDLRWQASLIAGSMDARSANRLADRAFAPTPSMSDELLPPVQRGELLEHALSLARDIESKAFFSRNGEPGWMVLGFSPESEQFALGSMEHDLYNGRAGLALFFAALEKVLPGSGYRALAHATLAPIRRWIAEATDRELARLGFGGYSGLSSIVYALTRAGGLLGDGDLIDEARCAALRIAQDEIDQDEILDAIGGSAGAILGLLACHAATGDAKVLAKAVACGRHLLARREADACGLRTWPTLDKAHLTGFSHGAAGIAYALLRLHEMTSDRELYDAAKEGIGFETHEFVPERDNWPDHRGAARNLQENPRFGMAWCHGAPGIGLGRIGALDVMDVPEVRRDIEAALRATGRVGLLPRDHLCCGNAGLIDTLCTAGERLARPECTREALRLVARTAARARRDGGFAVAFRNGFFNPGLFQGTAGVGYQMLRLASPGEIPSVLLLE